MKVSVVCSLVLTFLAQALTGQNTFKINNNVGVQHEKVLGTKIYMIPPKGFVQAEAPLIGFVQNSGSNSIVVNESAGSYKSLVQTFMTENMTVKGMKLLSQEKIMLNGSEATLLKLSQKVNRNSFTKFLLFFGEDDFCVLVSAIFPLNDAETERELRNALLSVAYKEEVESIPMPKGFRLAFDKSNLKYARTISDAVMYSADGTTSSTMMQKNSFFAGTGQVKSSDYAAFSAERLQKQIKTALSIEQNNPISLGGLPGQEIIATTTTSDGKTRTLYQVLLFNGENYYIMYGSTTENRVAQLPVFQALVKSFQLEK